MRGMKPLPDPDLVLPPAWRAIALGIVVAITLAVVALLVAAAGAHA